MQPKNLLLKADHIDAMQGESKTHFLNPNAVRINKSLGDAVGLQNLGVHLIYVEPGNDTTEYHKHHFEEECIYVISGKGRLVIEGEEFVFEQGDFVGFPANTAAHELANDGDETLVCMVIGQRLAQDVADYPKNNKRLYRNNGAWDLVDQNDIVNPRKTQKNK